MQKQKVVLITGCSSGFGLLTAKMLSTKKDCIVYASMRNLNKKSSLVKSVKKVKGQVNILKIDVTDPETIKRAVQKIVKEHGTIDVLVNNAGHAIGGFFEDLTDEEIREQIDVNFFGVQNMTREVVPIMHKNKSGRIINISSIAGLVSYPGLGAYNTSKWALEGFSESLRLELSRFGIKVILLEPGSFQTKIFDENVKVANSAFDFGSKYYAYTKYLMRNRIEKLKNFRGNPERVAKKIVKLIYAKNPCFRNIIGMDAFAAYYAKRILPFKIFEKLVNSAAFRSMSEK
ncbi:SDR family oxidoreductase [bacterium]